MGSLGCCGGYRICLASPSTQNYSSYGTEPVLRVKDQSHSAVKASKLCLLLLLVLVQMLECWVEPPKIVIVKTCVIKTRSSPELCPSQMSLCPRYGLMFLVLFSVFPPFCLTAQLGKPLVCV